MTKPLTHAYGHRLADMQFGGSAPAFTLSADGQMPIASVVMCSFKKIKYEKCPYSFYDYFIIPILFE